ncbi:MAG: hypothetical protein WDO70_05020 [Alphaproteobacteria bacterium]
MRSPSIACSLMFCLLVARPVWATDQQDLSVALKTLPLLTNKMTSPTAIAIVYNPASAASREDAESIKSIIDGGLEAPGGIKLLARLTSTEELSGLSAVKIAFMAHELPETDYGRVNEAASKAGVLTICTDIGCVKANKCVLGVVSRPQVVVYYSPVAAEAAKIGFAAAFTMLVKQVGSM